MGMVWYTHAIVCSVYMFVLIIRVDSDDKLHIEYTIGWKINTNIQ